MASEELLISFGVNLVCRTEQLLHQSSSDVNRRSVIKFCIRSATIGIPANLLCLICACLSVYVHIHVHLIRIASLY